MRSESAFRARLLDYLVEKKGYPRSLAALEKNPHKAKPSLVNSATTQRRFDLLFYYKKNEELCPLLLIECKVTPYDSKDLFQLVGYNHVICAPYLALVAPDYLLFSKRGQEFASLAEFPSYEDLYRSVWKKDCDQS